MYASGGDHVRYRTFLPARNDGLHLCVVSTRNESETAALEIMRIVRLAVVSNHVTLPSKDTITNVTVAEVAHAVKGSIICLRIYYERF